LGNKSVTWLLVVVVVVAEEMVVMEQRLHQYQLEQQRYL
jgi:hypothetical protein